VKGPGKGLGVDRQGRGATGLEGWKRRVWLGKETERIRKWIGRSGAEKEKHLSQIEKKQKVATLSRPYSVADQGFWQGEAVCHRWVRSGRIMHFSVEIVHSGEFSFFFFG